MFGPELVPVLDPVQDLVPNLDQVPVLLGQWPSESIAQGPGGKGSLGSPPEGDSVVSCMESRHRRERSLVQQQGASAYWTVLQLSSHSPSDDEQQFMYKLLCVSVFVYFFSSTGPHSSCSSNIAELVSASGHHRISSSDEQITGCCC